MQVQCSGGEERVFQGGREGLVSQAGNWTFAAVTFLGWTAVAAQERDGHTSERDE